MNCSTGCSNNTVNAYTYVNLITNYTALAISCIGVLANAFLITVIAKDKKLHSPCFALITGSAVGSTIMAVGYYFAKLSSLGVWKFINRRRIVCQCLSGFILKTISIPFNSQVAFLISLDRLFGTVSPVKYRRLGKRYVVAGFSTCALYGLAELVGLLARRPLDDTMPLCADIAGVFGSDFIQVFRTSNLLFCAMCVAGYVSMLICSQIQKNKVDAENEKNGFSSVAEKQFYLKQHRAIMPAATLLFALYFLLGIVPEIMYILSAFAGESGPILSIVGEQLKVTSSLVEFIALALRSGQFRQSVRDLWRRKTNAQIVVSQQQLAINKF